MDRSVLSLFLCLTLAQTIAAQDVRTWTAGGFKIQGKFVSLEDGEVTIEKTDGTEVGVPLGKLSKADQDYVKLQSENPFKPAGTTPKPSSGGALPDASNGAIVPDIKSVKVVKPNSTTSTKWKMEVTPQPLLDTKPKPIALRGLAGEQGIGQVIVNPRCQRALVSSDANRDSCDISLCDLNTGKVIETFTVNPPLTALAISDSGTRLALAHSPRFDHRAPKTVEIWDLTADGPKKQTAFVPYAPARNSGWSDATVWALFVEEDRLLTSSDRGTIVNWTLTSLKPKWVFSCGWNQEPTVSSDLKSLACISGNAVCLIDVTYGKVLTSQQIPMRGGRACLRFSPTGEKLALAAGGKLIVVNAADGSLIKTTLEEDRPDLPYFNDFTWVDEEHLLNGGTLVNLETMSEIWTYRSDKVRSYGGYALFGTSDRSGKLAALLPMKLPHRGAIEYRQKMEEHPELFLYCKGKTVELDLTGVVDSAKREEVEKSVRAQLKRLGITVMTPSEVKLVAKVDPAKADKIRVREWGSLFFQQPQEFSFQVVNCYLKLMWEDRVIWERSTTNFPPYLFDSKENETIEQTVRRYEADIYGRLSTIQLPVAIPRPDSGLPSNQLTSDVKPSGIH